MSLQHGTNQPEVSTASGSNSLSNIGLLYGSALSRELLAFGPAEDKKVGIVKVHGYASGAGHNGKKGVLLLFINSEFEAFSEVQGNASTKIQFCLWVCRSIGGIKQVQESNRSAIYRLPAQGLVPVRVPQVSLVCQLSGCANT
jgi:hypothetical protein